MEEEILFNRSFTRMKANFLINSLLYLRNLETQSTTMNYPYNGCIIW